MDLGVLFLDFYHETMYKDIHKMTNILINISPKQHTEAEITMSTVFI